MNRIHIFRAFRYTILVGIVILICACFCFTEKSGEGYIFELNQNNHTSWYDMATNKEESESTTNNYWIKEDQVEEDLQVPQKILIISYIRGGSSIAGELWDVTDSSMVWKEPMAAHFASTYGAGYATVDWLVNTNIYDRERIRFSPDEYQLLSAYLKNLLECDYDNLPAETWLHKFTRRLEHTLPIWRCSLLYNDGKSIFETCPNLKNSVADSRISGLHVLIQTAREYIQGKLTHPDIDQELNIYLLDLVSDGKFDITKNQVNETANHILCVERLKLRTIKCMQMAIDICKRAKLVVAAVNRPHMADVRPILEKIPDLHVIHYVRDPRATAASRINAAGLRVNHTVRDVTLEAKYMCKRLRDDLKERHSIEKDFPGSIIQMKYEDLVEKPIETGQWAYWSLNRRLPKEWVAHSGEAFHGNISEEGTFGTVRHNASDNVNRWKTQFSVEEQKEVLDVCCDVLDELGYTQSLFP